MKTPQIPPDAACVYPFQTIHRAAFTKKRLIVSNTIHKSLTKTFQTEEINSNLAF